MFKFLRKYSTWILGVGGTLLLITFLMPEAISRLAQYSASSGSTWATVGPGEEKVTAGEFDLLQRQTRLINELPPQNMLVQLGVGTSPGHWYLLKREAAAAGLIPGPSAGLAMAEQSAQNSQQGVTGEMIISSLGARSGLNYPQTIQTLAEIRGVLQLIDLIIGSGNRVSDSRIMSAAARKSLTTSADVLVIDARTNTQIDAPTPTEDQIAEQLAKYASNAPGNSELGFGYQIPNRFKIEWLTIPDSSIKQAVEQSDALDTVALRKAFLRDPAKYGAGPNITSSAATAPTFEQYRDRVRSTVLREQEEKVRGEIAKFANDQLQFPRRGLSKDGIHLVLPEDWSTRRLSLAELASEIQDQFGITLPAYESSGQDWLESDDLSPTTEGDYAELAKAQTNRFGRAPMNVQSVVEAIKEFGGNDTVPVQANVAFPPLTNIGGDLFIARVIAAEPARDPADADEVRDSVVEDLKGIFRFDEIEKQVPEMIEQARTDGIRSVANELDLSLDFVSNIRESSTGQIIFNSPTIIPGVNDSEAATKAIIEHASKLDPTRSLDDQPTLGRIFAVPLPEELKVLLVRLDKINPLTSNRWENRARDTLLLYQANQEIALENPNDLFSYEALRDRHAFVPSRSNDSEDDEDVDADSETPTTDA